MTTPVRRQRTQRCGPCHLKRPHLLQKRRIHNTSDAANCDGTAFNARATNDSANNDGTYKACASMEKLATMTIHTAATCIKIMLTALTKLESTLQVETTMPHSMLPFTMLSTLMFEPSTTSSIKTPVTMMPLLTTQVTTLH